MNRLLSIATLAICVSVSPLFAAGNPDTGKEKSAQCAACHGADGNSVNPEWPKLAGQNPKYLAKQLKDYKSKDRANPLMYGQAANLSEQDMLDLAAYFTGLTGSPGSADPDKVALGESIYRGGDLDTGLPACMGCHSPSGAGNPAAAYPKLSGQHSKYTETQLRYFRDGARKNDQAGMMRSIASKMTIEQIEAVAQYIAGLH